MASRKPGKSNWSGVVILGSGASIGTATSSMLCFMAVTLGGSEGEEKGWHPGLAIDHLLYTVRFFTVGRAVVGPTGFQLAAAIGFSSVPFGGRVRGWPTG